MHTADGKLVLELTYSYYPAHTPLKDIPLENEEEIKEKHKDIINDIAQVYIGADSEKYYRAVLDFYRRLKKLNCTMVTPLRYRRGYWRAKVKYPDGVERTWWSGTWSGWSTNGASQKQQVLRERREHER